MSGEFLGNFSLNEKVSNKSKSLSSPPHHSSIDFPFPSHLGERTGNRASLGWYIHQGPQCQLLHICLDQSWNGGSWAITKTSWIISLQFHFSVFCGAYYISFLFPAASCGIRMHYMNSMKLVIPLHFISWKKYSERCCDTTTPESIHTKDESKRGSAFAFIFGVNWPVQWM